jgi:DNA primase
VISPETIALVRDRTDILAVISEAVPSLKRRGRSWVGLCPFHKEKTPSFHVNPDRGFFHCFGCKESGSAIDFLIKNEGYTFPEAVRALAERAGIAIEETKSNVAFSEADRQRKAKDDLYAVNALAATYFEEQLRKNEHRSYALDELDRRGLMPGRDAAVDEALQAFRIGYAPSGWDGLTSFLRDQGVSPVAAETVGLLVPRSSGSGYYDRFRHRLMFAVVDAQGRVVAFSGRALKDLPGTESRDPDKGGPPPKYINSPESPIYTKGQMLFGIHQARHTIRSEETAILVEGNFDVVSLHARGLTNVVAPLGTAFTAEQAKLIKRFAGSVVFLFDGDAAGRKAVRLSREAIKQAGLSARVASLPDGVDPDELSKTRGIQAVKDLVGNAKGLLEALIDMALDEAFVSADAYERSGRVALVAKLLTEEDDPLVRSMAKSYADQLAGRLDFVRSPEGFRALEQSVKQSLVKAEAERRERAAKNGTPEVLQNPGQTRISPRTPGSGERKAIVVILIEWPALLDDPEVADELGMLEGPGALLVAALRRSWNAEEKVLDTDAFLAQIPDQVRPFAAAHVANPETESESQAKGYLLDNANKLKRLLLSQEAAQFARETYRAQGDWDTERELLREAAERLRAKHGLKP